jgi:hypothetical protein
MLSIPFIVIPIRSIDNASTPHQLRSLIEYARAACARACAPFELGLHRSCMSSSRTYLVLPPACAFSVSRCRCDALTMTARRCGAMCPTRCEVPRRGILLPVHRVDPSHRAREHRHRHTRYEESSTNFRGEESGERCEQHGCIILAHSHAMVRRARSRRETHVRACTPAHASESMSETLADV